MAILPGPSHPRDARIVHPIPRNVDQVTSNWGLANPIGRRRRHGGHCRAWASNRSAARRLEHPQRPGEGMKHLLARQSRLVAEHGGSEHLAIPQASCRRKARG